MARWKLTRLYFGNEEFTFLEGQEVTLGRGLNNTISLSSIVVSRNHCVINSNADNVFITDLKSSNGIYVGLKKIPPNIPFSLEDSDIIGIGWTKGANVTNVRDHEKYMFKLTKEKPPPITSRITFQSDNEGDIESKIAAIDGVEPPNNTPQQNDSTPSKQSPRKLSSDQKTSRNGQSPILITKPPVKRKIDKCFNVPLNKEKSDSYKIDGDVLYILSDSECEEPPRIEIPNKKQKLDTNHVDPLPIMKDNNIKIEKDDEYDVFKVKQEYLGNEDPIQIDSESDDESAKWLVRLSQSSPGKPFIKAARERKASKLQNEESSYSQIDDFEDFMDDIISIPPGLPENETVKESPDSGLGNKTSQYMDMEDEEEYLDDLILLNKPYEAPPTISKDDHADFGDNSSSNLQQESTSTMPLEKNKVEKLKIMEPHDIDTVDGSNSLLKDFKINSGSCSESPDKKKKAVVIDALAQPPKTKSDISLNDAKIRSSSTTSRNSKDRKNKKHSSSRRQITDSQKEERKKKLKDIATKEKSENDTRLGNHSSTSKDKLMVNAKVTGTNRGAFLTDVVQGVVKAMKRKESPPKSSKSKEKSDKNSCNMSVTKESGDNNENKKNKSESKQKAKDKSGKEHKSLKNKEKVEDIKAKSTNRESRKSSSETRVPLKNLKPLFESEDSFSGKPFSRVEPMPSKKPKKTVRFSEKPPVIHSYQIPEGNHMKKKTSLAKTSLLDARQAPVFSLEKISLMKILRWNTQWLEEQFNNNDPPPILGTTPPMAILHSFQTYNQYVQVVGDLLLMEIWECLTRGYMSTKDQSGIEMRIASLPPITSQDRYFELLNLSVNVSVPNSETKTVPRVGEIILVSFGPENARNRRFFYVYNVRTLPSPQNNRNSFYCISLHTCYTEKMRSLRPGELMAGVTLAYIQKELSLFEAMDNLTGSPLCEAILKPEPRHFVKCETNAAFPPSQWTKTLNPSQMAAVHSTVKAALSDRASIQMVQGPPGTGKSSVICAMVMSYFYDGASGRRQAGRGKVLICATSNAAVDGLVIRLLDIRQKLPKAERFRMVRVGRAEAMHPRALDISSQQLASRDAAARHHDPAHPAHSAVHEEISHLQARINMWRTQEQDAKDPVRAAYCKGLVKELQDRLTLLQSSVGGAAGGTGPVTAEQQLTIERRIIEGADIIVTTLASAQSHKLRGLRRRIALCIVDEAGQAIEPEALIPLTLDVTRLALVGDPQQLPGFICSQRAKKHGLGDSLFKRLTCCSEGWGNNSPVILLNHQYRMQQDIADYPNRAFYGSCIQSVPPTRPGGLDIPSYSVVCISSGDKGQGASGANEMEAWGVARLVLALHATLKGLNLSLAVITPYSAHKELIKRNLRQLQDPSEGHIEVNTVDSFQGQERDVVVASLARSQGVGFLTDAGRMNVMLTRARLALLLCLNPHALMKNNQWRTLIEDAQIRNLYRSLPHKICQGVSAGPIPHSDVLKHIALSKPAHK